MHCTEVITNDDAPTSAIRQKKDSSLVVALKLLKEDEEATGLCVRGIDGCGAHGRAPCAWGRIRGISRPAVCPVLPTAKERQRCCIIDAGANAECKPVNLCHFAADGHGVREGEWAWKIRAWGW